MNPNYYPLKKVYFIAFFISLFIHAFSTRPPVAVGSAAKGLANIRSLSNSAWSVYNMSCNMIDSMKWSTALFYSNPYHVSSLNHVGISTKYRRKTMALGACYSQLGYSISNQKTLTFSAGIQLNKTTSLGCSFHHLKHIIEQSNKYNERTISISFGRNLTEKVRVHFLAFTPIINLSKQYLPSTYLSGIRFNLSNETIVYFEIKSILHQNPSIATGLSYSIHDKVNLAIGVQSLPRTLSFGITTNVGNKKIGCSYQNNRAFGFSPTVDFQFSDQ